MARWINILAGWSVKSKNAAKKQVREDSAHKMAGPHFARKILGHELTEEQVRRSQAAFGADVIFSDAL